MILHFLLAIEKVSLILPFMNKPSMSKGLKSDFVMNHKDVDKLIAAAAQCEQDDDHLSSEQRAEVVRRFKEKYSPLQCPLPDDTEKAYLEIIFEWS